LVASRRAGLRTGSCRCCTAARSARAALPRRPHRGVEGDWSHCGSQASAGHHFIL